jgi:prefoldin subunit 5
VTLIDHSAELAELNKQITVLKKQIQVFRQEMTEKAGKDELATTLNEIESLHTEQKKTKRVADVLSNKKPVAAYVASGLAVAALLIGSGLGFQGLIAKSQVGELTQIIGKLQEQVSTAPAGDAADKEMTRKQLDELAVADSVMAGQIAEIKKNLQSDSGTGKAGGDAGKQIAELSSQNMQMGAAIETLENNVKALQKNRAVAAVTPVAPKPEKKAPQPVQENWAVNLIAFKQDWYAKRKAEEFAAKGVPAQVSKSELKGENWYRLSVDGFKSQYEAAGYAAKVKKTLNLDSVWVAKAPKD